MRLSIEEQELIQKISNNFFNKLVQLKLGKKLSINNVIDYIQKYQITVDKPFEFSYNSLSIALKIILKNKVTSKELEKTFYETFNDVTSKTRFDLFIDQILHYQSTYGEGKQGDEVYKPDHKLPSIVLSKTQIIKTFSLSAFLDKVSELLKSNIALKTSDILDITDLLKIFKDLIPKNIETIKNKELKIKLCLEFGIVPKDAQDFIKIIYTKLTDNTLFIKNREAIELIKNNNDQNEWILDYFNDYIKEYGYIPLANIFNRNKVILIALKKDKKINKIINKISKLSKRYHKPKIIPDYMKLTSNEFSLKKAIKIMDDLDLSYLIKIGNALSYKIKSNGLNIYNIRNGKYFIKRDLNYNFFKELNKDSNFYEKRLEELKLEEINKKKDLEILFNECKTMIETKLNKKIQELKLNITNSNKKIDLALPTTLKQFIGNYPYFSKINTNKKGLVLGVYWKNIDNLSIDLDLSCTNAFTKIGWDSDFNDQGIIFSGDMTDAKKGAVEAFKIESGVYMLNLNYYNYNSNLKPKYKFFIGKAFDSNRMKMIDPNNIIFSIEKEMDTQFQSIGCYNNGSFIFFNMKNINVSSANISNKDLMEIINTQIESKLLFKDLNLKSYTGKDQVKLDLSNPKKELLINLIK